MIKVIIELALVYPYVQSLLNLFDFISIWECTLISAKTLSSRATIGMSSDKFCFLGFLPPKSTARRKLLGQWVQVNASLIVFETAPRLASALEDIYNILGNREVAVVREITKMFEEVVRGEIQEILDYFENKAGKIKGEVTIIVY